MKIIANIFGILATIVFISSYQLKTRKNIIICSVISRLLYVLQYVFLGAYAGIALDLIAGIISVVAQKKDTKVIKKYFPLVVALCYISIIIVGALTYNNLFTIFAILGVIFEITAFWFSSEFKIRVLSLLGAPCWCAYNLKCLAYGSAIGNVITFISIIVAILRYHVFKKEK